MIKNYIIVCLFILSWTLTNAQVFNGQITTPNISTPVWHYQQEYTFDTTLNPAAWNTQQQGMLVSFASTDQLFSDQKFLYLKKRLKYGSVKVERANE